MTNKTPFPRPMDLQTIKRNIECGHTRNTAEFQRDIMLMATNAVFYNARGHNLHDRANCLLRDALAKIEVRMLVTGLFAQIRFPKVRFFQFYFFIFLGE